MLVKLWQRVMKGLRDREFPLEIPAPGSVFQGLKGGARYCVMQSDRNSFCGHVILDSVSKAFRDKDYTFDQIDKKN